MPFPIKPKAAAKAPPKMTQRPNSAVPAGKPAAKMPSKPAAGKGGLTPAQRAEVKRIVDAELAKKKG